MKKLLKFQLLVLLLTTISFADIEGGTNGNTAVDITVNETVILLPTHESAYQGTQQKYAWYKFSVPDVLLQRLLIEHQVMGAHG